MGPWVLLKAFETEAEARVVESFLASHDIKTQLLNTHSNYAQFAPGGRKTRGLHLLIGESELNRAKELLEQQERSAHLSLVEDGPPPSVDWRADKIVIVLLVLLTAIILVARYAVPN